MLHYGVTSDVAPDGTPTSQFTDAVTVLFE